MDGKKLGKADDKHHRSILDINDEVVADLRNDISECLGQNDADHGLHVCHADGLGPFGLARVHGDNAAPDGFRHIGAGVDGDDKDGRRPDIVKPQGVVAEIGQAIVNEHRLEHHRSPPKNLHINAHNNSDQLQQKPLGQGITFGIRNGVQHTTDKADQAPDQGSHHRQDQGVLDAVQIGTTVLAPQTHHIGAELGELFHRGALLSLFARNWAVRRPRRGTGGGGYE